MEACDVGLGLGLGVGGYAPPLRRLEVEKKKRPPPVCLDLFFAIRPKEEEEEDTGDGDVEADGSSLKMMIEHECKNKTNGGRKKLRLSKEQSSLLENSFKLQSNLNPAKKQALAEQLNLKPRQIEVWFQNRRARTKLKQTEADCEYLKKHCKNLSEENRKLNKQVQELRSHIQLQKAALCPSCEKLSPQM